MNKIVKQLLNTSILLATTYFFMVMITNLILIHIMSAEVIAENIAIFFLASVIIAAVICVKLNLMLKIGK